MRRAIRHPPTSVLKSTLACAALVSFALEGCRPMPENSHANAPPVAASDAKRDDADANAHDPRAVHARSILIDMHADTVQRMIDEGADISAR
ncbi:MAG TPA: hypothetical protein VER76_06155, partial [Pyrinomonadaceae bacterium]|nr:hypothetical protein [Pyrinomonadaceae bacterium]